MTRLQELALATLPLCEADVERLYSMPILTTAAQRLCESHERLRAELQGSQILCEDCEKEVADKKELLKRCLAAHPECICNWHARLGNPVKCLHCALKETLEGTP